MSFYTVVRTRKMLPPELVTVPSRNTADSKVLLKILVPLFHSAQISSVV